MMKACNCPGGALCIKCAPKQDQGKKVDAIRVLSFGGGVQSTAMLLTQKFDIAIFADTGWESKATLEHVERMKERFNIVTVRASQSIYDEGANGANGRSKIFRSLPLYLKDGNHLRMGRRQCTKEYKLEPIYRYLRKELQVKSATMLIGISIDERKRAKPSRRKWCTNEYPLITDRIDRLECEAICNREIGYIPAKSACVGCPFKRNDAWKRLHDESPDEWEDACRFDDLLRANGGYEYLHHYGVSLRDIAAIGFRKPDGENRPLPLFDTECVGGCWN